MHLYYHNCSYLRTSSELFSDHPLHTDWVAKKVSWMTSLAGSSCLDLGHSHFHEPLTLYIAATGIFMQAIVFNRGIMSKHGFPCISCGLESGQISFDGQQKPMLSNVHNYTYSYTSNIFCHFLQISSLSAKTKHRSKTHISPLKCHVKKCFYLNLKVRRGKGGVG